MTIIINNVNKRYGIGEWQVDGMSDHATPRTNGTGVASENYQVAQFALDYNYCCTTKRMKLTREAKLSYSGARQHKLQFCNHTPAKIISV